MEPLARQVQELQAKVEALTNEQEGSAPRTRRRKRVQQAEENPETPNEEVRGSSEGGGQDQDD